MNYYKEAIYDLVTYIFQGKLEKSIHLFGCNCNRDVFFGIGFSSAGGNDGCASLCGDMVNPLDRPSFTVLKQVLCRHFADCNSRG